MEQKPVHAPWIRSIACYPWSNIYPVGTISKAQNTEFVVDGFYLLSLFIFVIVQSGTILLHSITVPQSWRGVLCFCSVAIESHKNIYIFFQQQQSLITSSYLDEYTKFKYIIVERYDSKFRSPLSDLRYLAPYIHHENTKKQSLTETQGKKMGDSRR